MNVFFGTPVRTWLVVCVLAGAVLAQTQAPQSSSSAANPPNVGAAANTAAPVTAARPPRFVPILISATDGSGSPVKGLTKEQLSIQDSNQAVQPLQLYQDLPLHLGIVLLSASATFAQQQAAAVDLVQKVIRPGKDQAFVISARGPKPWPSNHLDWSQDPNQLATIINGLNPGTGMPDAFSFDMKTDEAGTDEDAGRYTLQTFGGGGVTIFDVVASMMSSDMRPSRRVVVIFREPWAHSPGLGNRANMAVERQVNRVIAGAQDLHIANFVIGLEDPKFSRISDANIGKTYISLHAGDDGGAGTANREYDRQMQEERIRAYDAGKSNIQRLASETGGTTYWSHKKNYSDAVNSIANQLAGQYIVVFPPSDVPGPLHPLKISSSSAPHVLAQTNFFYGAAK